MENAKNTASRTSTEDRGRYANAKETGRENENRATATAAATAAAAAQSTNIRG